MKAFLKLDRIIENVQTIISMGLFAGIIVLGAIQVFGRFILNATPP